MAPPPSLTRTVLALTLLVGGCAEGAEPPREAHAAPPSRAQTAAPRAYRCGTLLPPDPAAADRELRTSYAAWKAAHVTREGAGGALRVDAGPLYAHGTPSEAMGYGMLLAVYMDDRPTFDAFWRYTRRYLNRRGLIAWSVSREGRVLDENAATDGDEDVAFALVAADARWGGYREDAVRLVRSLMAHAVEPGTFVFKPGDVWGGSEVTNPSYFAPAYYKAFAAYTGDARWNRVADASYTVLDRVHARHSPATGLQPAWTTAAGDTVRLKGDFPFLYEYGAARVPWRLAMDAAWNCDPRAQRHLAKLNAFFHRVGARSIRDGYTLSGRPTGESHDVSFVAPAAAGALLSPHAEHRRALWSETVRMRNTGYYGDSLRLLALLLASGRMHPPRMAAAGR